MALNNVQMDVAHQLSKQIDIDCGNMIYPVHVIPAPMVNPPAQTVFGTYQLGYSPLIPPQFQPVVIPAAPPQGASSPHTYQAVTEQNLHPLLFQIEPHPEDYADIRVPLVIDHYTQQPVYGRDPNRQLRFFSFLPRWIDVNTRGEVLELWFRLDSRLLLTDIMDRLNVPANQQIPKVGAFAMRRNRFRALIKVPAWNTSKTRPLKADVELIGLMTREQILLNTGMIVDLQNGIFLKPVIRSGQIASYVDSLLPMNHFIAPFLPQPVEIPTERQYVAVLLRQRLQWLAWYRGLGSLTTNFAGLADADLPSWWVRPAPAVPRTIHEMDGLTHGEFLDSYLPVPPMAVVPGPAPAAVAAPAAGGGGGARARARAGGRRRRV